MLIINKQLQIKLQKYKYINNIKKIHISKMQPNTQHHPPRHFKTEMDTFTLELILDNDQLTIRLEDYEEWVVYEKLYTSSDIGKQIHKRVQLNQIYESFLDCKTEGDAKLIEQKQRYPHKGTYKFGEIVKKQGDIPCYKIQKGGKITSYISMLVRKNNQQITFQSHLTLNKIKQLNQIQIIRSKSSIERRLFQQKIQKQIYNVKKQKQQLAQRVRTLQHNNIQLKQQVSKLQKQLQSTTQYFNKKYQQLTLELNNRQKLTASSQLKAKSSSQLCSLQLPYRNKFKIYDYKLEYVAYQPCGYTQFIFNQRIPWESVYSFSIKVLNTENREILIGVIDYQRQQNQKSSYDSNNAVCYYGGNGNKWPGPVREGGGFKEGHIVQVEVDRVNGIIKWKANGDLKATYKNQILSDNSRVLMPYVEMYYPGDIIEWCH